MTLPRPLTYQNIAFLCAGGAAVSTLISIAACQILLGASIVAILLGRFANRESSDLPLRFPPILWPLSIWVGWTLLSILVNRHALQALPQVRKFYVYLILLAVPTAVRGLAQVGLVIRWWTIAAAASAAWSLVQFYEKYAEAARLNRRFYEFYVGERTTGFMSHWMSFSGEMMVVLLFVMAVLFFAPIDRRTRLLFGGAGLLIALGLVLAFTRSMWVGAGVGGLILLWNWRRWTVLLAPVPVIAILLLNPFALGDRLISSFKPHGEVDSNLHREICRRVGYAMIKAHPLFGVGPEQVGPRFKDYLPADIKRPLPPGYYEHLHNNYLHFAAERGIPAVLALLAMIAKVLFDFIRGLRNNRANPAARSVLLGAVASIVAMLVSGWVEVNLGTSPTLTLFLAVVGCGYVALWDAGDPAELRPAVAPAA